MSRWVFTLGILDLLSWARSLEEDEEELEEDEVVAFLRKAPPPPEPAAPSSLFLAFSEAFSKALGCSSIASAVSGWKARRFSQRRCAGQRCGSCLHQRAATCSSSHTSLTCWGGQTRAGSAAGSGRPHPPTNDACSVRLAHCPVPLTHHHWTSSLGICRGHARTSRVAGIRRPAATFTYCWLRRAGFENPCLQKEFPSGESW